VLSEGWEVSLLEGGIKVHLLLDNQLSGPAFEDMLCYTLSASKLTNDRLFFLYVNPLQTKCRLLYLTFWPWKWAFKLYYIIYVKCEYFMNQKGNVMKYMTFCRGIN
jgi:hypothetical protein